MISRFFIDRPIFASVLSLIILLAGAVTLSSLPLAYLFTGLGNIPRILVPDGTNYEHHYR